MIDFLTANWSEIAGVVAAIVLGFDRLAKIFPTLNKNGTVSKLYRLLALFGLKVKDNEGPVGQ